MSEQEPDPFTLTLEETIALVSYLSKQYIAYELDVLHKLIQRLEKALDDNEEAWQNLS